MKKVLIVFVILCSLSVKGQWTKLNSTNSKDLNSVHFIDDKTGWVCGDSGVIMKTADGGTNWNSYNVSDLFNLLSIRFYDSLKGIVVGTKSVIYTTEDGGITWALKNLNPDINLNQVRYIDSAKVLVVGNSGRMLLSTDWGNSWTTPGTPALSNDLHSISFLTNKIGWVGADNSIIKTINGGTIWLSKGESWRDTQIFAFNDSLLWKTSWTRPQGSLEPLSYTERSTNGGKNWTVQDINIGNVLKSIFMCNPNIGYILNYNIISTTNGGTNWEQNGIFSLAQLNDFCFIDSARGWVVGDSGFIYKTITGGVLFTGIDKDENLSPNFMLLQNYPNPFNPVTKITYSIPQTGFVKLKVFDLLGNEIITLVNEEKQSGNYEVEFDGSRLPSGIYFYQAIVGKNVITKKMALIK